MSSADESRGAAEFCAELVRSHDFGRYASTLFVPPALRRVRVVLEPMLTGPAVRTYNIMIGERRRVAAALIAVP